MKPFNLERALAGDPVVTRSGSKVQRIVHWPEVTADHCRVVALVDGSVQTFHEDGIFFPISDATTYRQTDLATYRQMDLMMAPRKRTVWVNLYRADYEDGKCSFGGAHKTEQLADDFAGDAVRVGNRAYPIEIEE